MDQELQDLLQEFYAIRAAPWPHSRPHFLGPQLDRIGVLPGPNPDLHCGYHAHTYFLGLNGYHAASFLMTTQKALQLALIRSRAARCSLRLFARVGQVFS